MKYKIITIIFYLSLVCLILPQAVHAAIYYVDIDGVGEDGILGTGDDVVSDDANPGTSEQPWKTLNRAYTWYSGSGVKVQEGDTVLFRNGDYGAFTESTRYNPGETWLFYRNDWITYKADTGHSPILTKVEIHNEDKWGEIEHGRSYLKFDGFNVLQGVGAAYTSYVQILDCNVTGGGLIPYEGMYAPYYTPNTSAVSLGGNGMRIENCKVSYGWRGITIGGPNAVVKSNAVHRFAEDGIEAGSTGVGPTLIDDNHIYDANPRRSTYDISGTLDGSFTNGQAITQAGTNAEGIVYNYAGKYGTIAVLSTSVAGFLKQSYGGGTITGPTGTLSNISLVDGAHSDGIQIHSTVSNVTITNNIIHGGMWNLIKLACYTGGSVQNVTVANNLGYNTTNYALYMASEGGTPYGVFDNVNFYNNTFWGTARMFHLRWGAQIDNLYNNIITRLAVDTVAEGVVNHGNNIFCENPNNTGPAENKFYMNETEALTSTPGFVDVDNDDFHLAAGSAAIDFGTATYAPTTDKDGNARVKEPDAGCYEYAEASGDILGDITGDGEVSINDVQACVSIILFAETDLGMIERADISGETVGEPDEEVNIYDLQELVNMVLSS